MAHNRKHRWPVCIATGKQRFKERKDAKLAVKAATFARGRAARDGLVSSWQIVRVYKCSGAGLNGKPGCGGWHTTSRPIPSNPSPAMSAATVVAAVANAARSAA